MCLFEGGQMDVFSLKWPFAGTDFGDAVTRWQRRGADLAGRL